MSATTAASKRSNIEGARWWRRTPSAALRISACGRSCCGTDFRTSATTLIAAPYPTLGAQLLERKVDLTALPAPFTYDPVFKANAHILFTLKEGLGPTQQLVTAARRDFSSATVLPSPTFSRTTSSRCAGSSTPRTAARRSAFWAAFTKLPPGQFAGWAFTRDDFYHDPQARPNIPALEAEPGDAAGARLPCRRRSTRRPMST